MATLISDSPFSINGAPVWQPNRVLSTSGQPFSASYLGHIHTTAEVEATNCPVIVEGGAVVPPHTVVRVTVTSPRVNHLPATCTVEVLTPEPIL